MGSAPGGGPHPTGRAKWNWIPKARDYGHFVHPCVLIPKGATHIWEMLSRHWPHGVMKERIIP